MSIPVDAQQPGGSHPATDVITDHPAPLVPDWLINLAALGWRVIAIALLAIVLWLLSSMLWVVTASIAVATVISAVVAPFVMRLTRAGRSRTAAAAIAWVVALATVIGTIVLLAIAFVPYIVQVATQASDAIAALQARLAALDIPPAAAAAIRAIFEFAGRGAAQAGAGAASSLGGVATVLILSAFLIFFFVRDGDRAWQWGVQGLPAAKRDEITTAATQALERVGGYLRGTAVLSAIIAITDLVFMLLLGVPLAVPLAILVFFAGFIPYFGGLVTTVLIVLITYAVLGPVQVVILLILVGIRNMILGYGIRPALYGRTTGIHPALVLVVLPAGFAVAGVVGLFVAVPIAAIIFAVASAVVSILDPDEPTALPALIPPWFDRIAQWSWRLLLVFALVAVLVGVFVTIPMVILPIILAMVLAATGDPFVKALVRRGRARGSSAALVVAGGTLAVLGMIALAVLVLFDQSAAIGEAAFSGAQIASGAFGGHLGPLVQLVAGGGRDVIGIITTLINDIASAAIVLLISLLLAFYLLRDGRPLWARIVRRAAPPMQGEFNAAGKRAFSVLGGYMTGTALISLVGSASQLAIMIVLGIPLALPVFVLSFFLCFIPYIGGFISTGIALLLTVAFGSPTDIAIMVIWTLVFNIVTGNIVSPIVYGRTVHLHPAIVLVAIPAGAAIAGILGMFFIVPMLGVVAVSWRMVVDLTGAHTRRMTPAAELPMPEAPTDSPLVVAADLPIA
jgi:putative heme transporter